eukprot:1294737-Rhodomonas_salina.3
MGGGLLPTTTGQALGSAAVAMSTINIVGGFIITQRMLDMFKRKDDPPEYSHYYAIPMATLAGGYFLTTKVATLSLFALGCACRSRTYFHSHACSQSFPTLTCFHRMLYAQSRFTRTLTVL